MAQVLLSMDEFKQMENKLSTVKKLKKKYKISIDILEVW